MFLKRIRVPKNGKRHTYWALVKSVRTARGPRHQVVAYLGELHPSQQDCPKKTFSLSSAPKQMSRASRGYPAVPVSEDRPIVAEVAQVEHLIAKKFFLSSPGAA